MATKTGVSATHEQAGMYGLLTHIFSLLQFVHMCKSTAYSNAADNASTRKACNLLPDLLPMVEALCADWLRRAEVPLRTAFTESCSFPALAQHSHYTNVESVGWPVIC